MNWRKLLWTILVVGGILPTVRGESQHGTVTDKEHHVTKPFSSAVSDVYMLSASSADGWIFVKEYNFPQNNGWFEVAPGSYSIMCYDNTAPREGAMTVFVDAASVFSATLSGQMYKEGTEPGSLTSWSVTGTPTAMASQSVDPVEKILSLSEGDRAFRYLINGELAPGGLWKYSGTDVTGTTVQIDWQNSGATYNLPTTLKAGQYTLTAARNSNGALSATATAKIVEVKSVSAGEITSTVDSSAANIPTLYVERKDNTTITVTATPEPGSDWPANYPSWSGGGTVDSNDPAKYIIPGNVAASYTVTATCGNEKAIKIVVVDVIIKEGTTIVSDGTSRDKIVGQKVSLTAEILPAGLMVTSKEWTIPGTRIKNYTATSTSTTLTQLSATDLNNTSISYYWVDGADARNVNFSISIDIGNNKKFEKGATAIYHISRPSINFSGTTSSVNIDDRNIPNRLIFADIIAQQDGIVFNTSSNGPPVNGVYAYWQCINTTVHTLTKVDNSVTIKSSSIPLCDMGVPYPYGGDSPGQSLPIDDVYAFCNDSFTTWLMFQPGGNDSIWIPISSFNWSWSGIAQKSGLNSWSIISRSNTNNPVGSATTVFPYWTGKAQDLTWKKQ